MPETRGRLTPPQQIVMDAAARGPIFHIKGGWVSGIGEDGAGPGICSVGVQTVFALVKKGMLVKMAVDRDGDRLARYELPGY